METYLKNHPSILSYRSIGVSKAFDLEVDHKDHNFYANGLITSNSHSTSYATLSAQSLALKYKYPKEFFCSLLNCSRFEQNPREEIEKICGELDYFGIKLLPPSLVSSKENFSVEGNDIRYGLSSIKGVSEKSIQKLLDFRGLVAENKYDMFLIAKDSGINIGLLSSLIQSGCLDAYGDDRCKIVLEAQAFNILTDKEKRIVKNLGEKYKYDLLQTIADCRNLNLPVDGEKPLFKETRWGTFFKKYSGYKEIYKKNHSHRHFANWFFERTLLGYTYSCSLKDCFSFSKDFTQIKDLKFTPNQDRISIICIVTDIMRGKGKQSGNKYMKLVIQDESGTFSAMVVASKNNRKAEHVLDELSKLTKESIITISGQKTEDVIFIDKAEILNEKIYMKLSQLKD